MILNPQQAGNMAFGEPTKSNGVPLLKYMLLRL